MDDSKERQIIWRHDIDMSVHRAYSLAKLERGLGVKSTFFILPHSEFYNFFIEKNYIYGT